MRIVNLSSTMPGFILIMFHFFVGRRTYSRFVEFLSTTDDFIDPELNLVVGIVVAMRTVIVSIGDVRLRTADRQKHSWIVLEAFVAKISTQVIGVRTNVRR